jgi:hypothetical protein
MTEAEWRAATDPTPMLEFLKNKATARKLWRYTLGCGEPTEVDPRFFLAAELHSEGGRSEQFLQFLANHGLSELQVAWVNAYRMAENAPATSDWPALRWLRRAFTPSASRYPVGEVQAGLLRDIFGNPFRSVTTNPTWLTFNVVALAEGIYADRAFDRLPILADALQDAGCANPEVLSHCRDGGVHVRGCWVVDLLLGKG